MAEGNRPDFDVFAVREREGSGKDIFVKIGVAFKRRNEAEGVNIMLDALPLGRRLVVVPPLHDDADRR